MMESTHESPLRKRAYPRSKTILWPAYCSILSCWALLATVCRIWPSTSESLVGFCKSSSTEHTPAISATDRVPQHLWSSKYLVSHTTCNTTTTPSKRKSVHRLQLDQSLEALISVQPKWSTSFQATSSLKYREHPSVQPFQSLSGIFYHSPFDRNWPFHIPGWCINPPAPSVYCVHLYSFQGKEEHEDCNRRLVFHETSESNAQAGCCYQSSGGASTSQAAQGICVLTSRMSSLHVSYFHLSFLIYGIKNWISVDAIGMHGRISMARLRTCANTFTRPIGQSTVSLLSQINSKAGKQLHKARYQK